MTFTYQKWSAMLTSNWQAENLIHGFSELLVSAGWHEISKYQYKNNIIKMMFNNDFTGCEITYDCMASIPTRSLFKWKSFVMESFSPSAWVEQGHVEVVDDALADCF